MSNIFTIGLSGLNAAKAALEVTSHNISNVNTEGYSRQRVSQSATLPQFMGYGYVGRGVDLDGVTRIHDTFMESQINKIKASTAGFSTQARALSDLDNLLADVSTGVTQVIQGFHESTQALSQQPTSIPVRQAVLSQAENVAGRFTSLGTQIEETRGQLINKVANSVDELNAYAKQVASLNKQIIQLTQGEARVPNDLLDKRDAIVGQMNKLMKVDRNIQSDGSYNLFIGQGHPFVLGESQYDIGMVQGGAAQPEDPQAPSLVIKIPDTNNTVAVNSDMINGGEIAGALTVLNHDLPRLQADVGRMAIEFSDAVNRQHSLGYDLNGQPATGGVFNDLSADLTTAYTMTTRAGQARVLREALGKFGVAIQNPSSLAVSSGVVTTPVVAPLVATDAKIPAIWQVASLSPAANTPLPGPTVPPAPPTPTLTLNFNPAAAPAFTADYGGATIPVTQSKNQSGVWQFDLPTGVTLAFRYEGGTKAGAINVQAATPPMTASALNNANILEMGRLQSRNMMAPTPTSPTTLLPAAGSNRTASFQSFYGQAVSYVGSRTNVINVSFDSQTAALQEVSLKKESLSGVNLDEEAANLIRYQQAYQASSKSIQIAQEMFRSVLEMGR